MIPSPQAYKEIARTYLGQDTFNLCRVHPLAYPSRYAEYDLYVAAVGLFNL